MSTEILQYGRVTWTNIIHPTDEDMQALSKRYPNFHPMHLGNCLTELEFPKLDATDGYIFLVAQLPRWLYFSWCLLSEPVAGLHQRLFCIR
ncbi:MAG: hypothetical protein H6657_01185 [Ardenticatenaceae bacterium]|nr:hypothetical protein [Ardenticatenaceae bacterium]